MSKRLSSDDIGVLIDNWEDIRKLVNDILKNKLKNKAMLKGLVPIEFDKDLVLGYGDWGLVMGLPGLVEIVLKITTDPFEWYLTNIILQKQIIAAPPERIGHVEESSLVAHVPVGEGL